MAILLKTASARVSSIQIMQVRVQNKGKSVWKSIYDGDVSLPRTHGNYRQASFHHAHMIRVRYFDNLVCGWTGAWVMPLLGQASHL